MMWPPAVAALPGVWLCSPSKQSDASAPLAFTVLLAERDAPAYAEAAAYSAVQLPMMHSKERVLRHGYAPLLRRPLPAAPYPYKATFKLKERI